MRPNAVPIYRKTFSSQACIALLFSAVLCSTAGALSLNEAEQQALQNHPDARLAAAGRDAAVAAHVSAAQAVNPTLALQTGNMNPGNGMGAWPLIHSPMDASVGLSYLVERGDKRALRTQAAQAGVGAAQHDEAELRRQLRLGVHLSYFDLKLAQDRESLVQSSVELQQRSFDIAGKRFQSGDLSAVDVARLQTELVRAKADLRSAQANTLQARQTLAQRLGPEAQPKAAELSADDAYPQAGASPEPTATTERADVRSAAQRVTAAEQNLALSRASTTRDVTVGVALERHPQTNGSISFSLSVPLFWGYSFEGEQRKAEVDLNMSRLQRQRSEMSAQADQAIAQEQLKAATLRRSELDGPAQQAARQALDGMELAYRKGAASLTDVLDARRQWQALQLDLVQARADEAKALSTWLAATQWER
ncbi:MAG: TolC family protein [Leptothrix ochracea]|uniref:TolC family protein n=1 Tax=Leptothrix ochracea TaxID=735331 RepID=UPI0034E1C5E8